MPFTNSSLGAPQPDTSSPVHVPPSAVPVPYPNMAFGAPSTSGTTKMNMLVCQGLSREGASNAVNGTPVTNSVDKAMLRNIASKNPVHLQSKIPATTGDEGGTQGGVVSGPTMARNTSAFTVPTSFKVLVNR